MSCGTLTAWIASIGKFILFWELSRSSESFEAGLARLAEADLEIESGTMLGSLTDMIIVPSGTLGHIQQQFQPWQASLKR